MLTVIHYVPTMSIICFVILCARISYLILQKSKKKQNRLQPVKTLIVLGSGGHTAEMLRILSHLSFNNYSPRIYVHARTDRMSAVKAKQFEDNNIDYKIIEIYRSREVHQSYFTSIWSTLLAILDSIPVIWNESPELILCNGPGTCIPLCIIAFFLKIFYVTQVKIFFVESFCRVKYLSLTGKILYYIADHIIVQWAYLSAPNYNRAVYL